MKAVKVKLNSKNINQPNFGDLNFAIINFFSSFERTLHSPSIVYYFIKVTFHLLLLAAENDSEPVKVAHFFGI